MFMGHYATALIPYEIIKTKDARSSGISEKPKRAPFWIFLVAAQLLDFAMLVLVSLGIEGFKPEQYVLFDTKFYNMQTDMLYTHDLVPVLGWAIGFALIALLITRRTTIALWSFGLVIFHEILDLIVGFKHNVYGHDTAEVGLALYTNAATLGIMIEAAMCACIVWWFLHSRQNRGVQSSGKLKAVLYGMLVGGTVVTLPMAL